MGRMAFTGKSGLLLIGFGLSCLGLHAQTPDPTVFQPVQPPKQIQAVRATGRLTINGRLDESDWQGAPSATGFFQAQPEQGKQPANDTRIRVLFDNKNVYIGAFCPDSLGRKALRLPDLRRDFDYFANDLVGVSFDPFRDQRNAQAFQTNPFGAQRDLLCADDALFDRDWDGYWKVRTTRTDSGWVAEMQLPWVTLRYPRPDSTAQNWGINFVRISRRINEQTFWSPVPRAYTVYRMTYAGLLTGLEPPPPSTNIRLQPYVLYEYNRAAPSCFVWMPWPCRRLFTGNCPARGYWDSCWRSSPFTRLPWGRLPGWPCPKSSRTASGVTPWPWLRWRSGSPISLPRLRFRS